MNTILMGFAVFVGLVFIPITAARIVGIEFNTGGFVALLGTAGFIAFLIALIYAGRS